MLTSSQANVQQVFFVNFENERKIYHCNAVCTRTDILMLPSGSGDRQAWTVQVKIHIQRKIAAIIHGEIHVVSSFLINWFDHSSLYTAFPHKGLPFTVTVSFTMEHTVHVQNQKSTQARRYKARGKLHARGVDSSSWGNH